MTIRITSVPRDNAPNSGYHPNFFAEEHNDCVWAIPNKGEYIGSYRNIRFVWCDINPLRPFLGARLIRIFAFFAFFFRAIVLPRQIIFVHSFIFCIPLWAARQNYVLFIHGSDEKYLNTGFGAFFAQKAIRVFGIGFFLERNNLIVKEIPNIFDLDKLKRIKASTQVNYDVIFVTREASVKNPHYPYKLFINTSEKKPLRIAVVGLSQDFLNEFKIQKITEKENLTRSIDYFGRRSFEEVGNLMKTSNVMILPSHSEGVSKAMLEALYLGLHVIVSNKLRIPIEFEEVLIRVDLENWEEVFRLIKSCKKYGLNQVNIDFAKAYLKRSIELLNEIYRESSSSFNTASLPPFPLR